MVDAAFLEALLGETARAEHTWIPEDDEGSFSRQKSGSITQFPDSSELANKMERPYPENLPLHEVLGVPNPEPKAETVNKLNSRVPLANKKELQCCKPRTFRQLSRPYWPKLKAMSDDDTTHHAVTCEKDAHDAFTNADINARVNCDVGLNSSHDLGMDMVSIRTPVAKAPLRRTRASPTLGPRRLKGRSEPMSTGDTHKFGSNTYSVASYATDPMTEDSRASSLSLDGFSQISQSSAETKEPQIPQKVGKDALEMLSRTFPDLADRGLIADVLGSIPDLDKAFEHLQILQDEFTAAETEKRLAKTPPRKVHETSWDEALARLSSQYPDVPGEDVARLLAEADCEFSHAEGLLDAFNAKVQQRIEEDQALAEHLSSELERLSVYQGTPKKLEPVPAQEKSIDDPAFDAFCLHFPSTSKEIVKQAFLVCQRNEAMAAEFMERHDRTAPSTQNLVRHDKRLEAEQAKQEFQCTPVKSGRPSHSFRASESGSRRLDRFREDSRSSSPVSHHSAAISHHSNYIASSGVRPQNVYIEARRPVMALQRQIDDLKAEQAECYSTGQHLKAHVIESQVRSLVQDLKIKEAQASSIIAREMNKANMIKYPMDLHGLHVKEALDKLHRAVTKAIAEEDQDTEMYVVTGRGNGSINNVPKLKNAVIDYLRTRGIAWHFDQRNDGALSFQIAHQKPLKPWNPYQQFARGW